MNNYFRVWLGIGALAFFGAAGHAATLTVINTMNNGTGSLRAAIASANAGDTIQFQAGLTGIIQLAATYTIDKSLGFEGSGADITIDGNGHRIFMVTSNAIGIFDDLTFINGTTLEEDNEGGGAILNESYFMAISNCKFINCSTGYSAGGGGAIYSISQLGINNCVFSNNYTGDANINGGGAIYNSSDDLEINNCIFAGNSDYTIQGGGAIKNDGTLTLNACTFYDNRSCNGIVSGWDGVVNPTVSGGGGAIYNSKKSKLNLVDCTLTGNSITNNYGGGAIYSENKMSMIYCTVSSNSAVENSATACAGGVYCLMTTTVANTIISGNQGDHPDVFCQAISSNGHNLVGHIGDSGIWQSTDLKNVSPKLGPLQNNGGPVPTMSLLAGSPAIDAGADGQLDSTGNGIFVDGRGYPRTSGGHVDIGAVEDQFASTPPLLKNPVWSTNGASASLKFNFTNTTQMDFTALATTNLSLPMTNWTAVGNATEISAGHYRFNDYTATNFPWRFYRIVSP